MQLELFQGIFFMVFMAFSPQIFCQSPNNRKSFCDEQLGNRAFKKFHERHCG